MFKVNILIIIINIILIVYLYELEAFLSGVGNFLGVLEYYADFNKQHIKALDVGCFLNALLTFTSQFFPKRPGCYKSWPW